jgi:hypothetical protein
VKKSRIVLTLVLFLIALSLTTVEARELFVNATDVVVIRPSVASQDMHLLMKFSLPEVLTGESVDFACVSFDAGCSGSKGAVSLEAFRVTTAWDAASVSWAAPWSKDGGDWDSDMSADWVVPVGEGKTVYLDVTDFVNGWLKDPSSNFGIVVRVSEPFLGTFSTVGSRGLPKLRVLY